MKSLNYPLQHIYQKNRTGCGIACISMIANISYDDVAKIIIEEKKLYEFKNGLNEDQIRKVLDKLGFSMSKGWTPCTYEDLKYKKTHCLIAYETHWVLYDHINKQILDPARVKKYEEIDSVLKIFKKN